MANVPFGLCGCGCGQPTSIAPRTYSRNGWFKGQPLRYVHGHNSRKTSGISYSAAHKYLSRHYPKTGKCIQCGGTERKTEYALIHGREHSHSRDDYLELCVPCHKWYDLGGERGSNVKLTEQAVREIRIKRAAGASLLALAAEYGVNFSTISGIARRKSWKGVVP